MWVMRPGLRSWWRTDWCGRVSCRPSRFGTCENLLGIANSSYKSVRAKRNAYETLEDAGIKLSSVVSDIKGESARAMLNALVAGIHDPQVLADLARGQLRKKLPALRQALTGWFGPVHRILVSEILAHLDYIDETVDRLGAEVENTIAPFASAVDLLDTIPGINRRTAEVVIAEIGADMTRFPSEQQLRMGWHVSGQQRVGWQAFFRQDAQRIALAAPSLSGVGAGCRPN